MNPLMLQAYEQELRYFRESAAEFASAFPKIARRLGVDGQDIADPYVERLIEATAFLAARVHLKVDAEYPCFTGHLLDIVYPHFLAPTPAMGVCAFAPDLDEVNLAQGRRVPRGSALRAKQAAGQNTHCEFRTAHEVCLWPLKIRSAQYFTYAPELPLTQHPAAREIRGGLRIGLQATAGLNLSALALDELVLYLGGADDVAWQLYECLLGNPVDVMLRDVSADAAMSTVAWVLPEAQIEAVGFADDEALLPQTATGFSGFRLVQEYFALPERFRFVRIKGLAKHLGACKGPEAELVVLFSRGDAALEKLVAADNVQLNCTPVINLFPKSLDRVMVNEGVSQFHLLADRTRAQDFEVHSITQVMGHAAPGDGVREQTFMPFYAAFHGSRDSHPAYYTTTREPRVMAERERAQGPRSSHVGSELYLQLVDPQQAPFVGSLRQLAVSALVTNRDLPLLLPLGRSQDLECLESFPVRGVRMVSALSRPVSPVVDKGLGWRVVDHLAINYLSLSEASPAQGAAALREMLSLYAKYADNVRQAQVRGLLSVRSAPLVRRLPMAGPIAFGRGLEVMLEVDATAFHGHSAFLFGSVLAHWLRRHVELNHFVETVLTVSGKGELMRWRAMCGTRPIL